MFPNRILCFGEILWDFLPAGLFPGGAPFNVGYHLQQHGADVRLLSAVGHDRLGDELLRRLRHWNMDPGLIARHADLPTGYVVATLATTGDARYEIAADVAWDRILVDEHATHTAGDARALVFGSLAQRSLHNRHALDRLLHALPETSWRVFDVNLRPPHDDLELVRSLASRATLLKLNADEAARLANESPIADPAQLPAAAERQARSLAAAHGCRIVCITAAEHGAGLLRDGTWHWEPGRPVEVADTVGAGDSFLASLLTHLLAAKEPDAACLARACRTGEWVATQRGATPAYPKK